MRAPSSVPRAGAIIALSLLGSFVVGASILALVRHDTHPSSPTRTLAHAKKEMVAKRSALWWYAEPAPEATEATTSPSTASATRTGVLHVPPSVGGMLVDGVPRRVNGATVLTCGTHAIKTGIAPAREVHVPCGGNAWL